ncbi:MAG: hypothetical protein KIS67_10275 [Verrucomicrobiae bacterium]|nr:hypothetical protein [Verrucomicrobiae bacterium]
MKWIAANGAGKPTQFPYGDPAMASQHKSAKNFRQIASRLRGAAMFHWPGKKGVSRSHGHQLLGGTNE